MTTMMHDDDGFIESSTMPVPIPFPAKVAACIVIPIVGGWYIMNATNKYEAEHRHVCSIC